MLFEWFLIGVLFQYQKFVDRLKVKAQDQVMLILLFAYQLKMQMCNMITGQSKDKATRRWVLSCHNTLCIFMVSVQFAVGNDAEEPGRESV